MLCFVPYLEPLRLPLGGTRSVDAWSVLVALSLVAGVRLARRAAAREGLDSGVVTGTAGWGLAGGFVGAHLVHLLLYEPRLLAENPVSVLWIWNGLSSFGGFFGAAVATTLYFRRRDESFWSYADALTLGFVPAWGIARVGCFLAHDHPGRRSDFFLAVDFPGGPRHDLGLYEALLSFALAAALHLGAARRPRAGMLAGTACLVYAAARFFLDFLRATDLPRSDARYLGLTPAQYGAVVLAGFGAYLLWRSRAADSSERGAA